uniref:Uncharacterized protein n=1 Tax=Panagrolaimus sp. ES5 TaxID=591445 RepID=A0AC34G005_9BILA
MLENNQLELPFEARNLVQAHFAYRVTDVCGKKDKPRFTELRFQIANDKMYDGILVGLPCVFFSTTKWGNGLTTTSPYPSNADPNTINWRAKVSLDVFKGYDMWIVKNIPSSQIQLLLTEGDEKRYVENLPGIEAINKANNKYLCYFNGNWVTNDYQNDKTKWFVNLVLL